MVTVHIFVSLDGLRHGHLAYFAVARRGARADYVSTFLVGDHILERNKSRLPLFSQNQRAAFAVSEDLVDAVFKLPRDDLLDLDALLGLVRPGDFYPLGYDQMSAPFTRKLVSDLSRHIGPSHISPLPFLSPSAQKVILRSP